MNATPPLQGRVQVLEAWICHHLSRRALEHVVRAAFGDQLLGRLPSQLASDVMFTHELLRTLEGDGALDQAFFAALLGATRRGPRARQDLLELAERFGLDLPSLRVSSASSDPLAPYLRAVQDAANERTALRRTRVPLRKVWIEPLMQFPSAPEPMSLSAWLREPTVPGGRVLITGELGTGKSELLLATAGELARVAQDDLDAPIPLLVDAVDLAGRRSFLAALASRWPGMSGVIDLICSTPTTQLWILVDRFDEADDSAVELLQRELSAFTSRSIGQALATRPIRKPYFSSGWANASLPRWSEAKRDDYLDAWAAQDPAGAESVRIVREQLHARPLIDEWLGIPLTATICLIVAQTEPDSLAHRTLLIRAFVEHLFEDWAVRRHDPPSWDGCEPALRRWAYLLLTRRRTAIDEGELRQYTRSKRPTSSARFLAELETELGVLVRRGNGYEFLFRSLAEYLAGRELQERGARDILAAARAPWGVEPVRHAFGLMVNDFDDSDAPAELLAELLEPEQRDIPGLVDEHLRSVLAALEVAADAPEFAARLAEPLVRGAMRRITEEHSMWVGDVVARTAQRLCTAGGPAGDLLFERCAEILESSLPHGADDVPTTSLPSDRRALLQLAHHRAPAVRLAVVQRLRAHLEHEDVQRALLQLTLEDDDHRTSVPMEAALALHAVPRDRLVPQVRAGLLELLADPTLGGPYLHVALALHPHEAPVDQLAEALTICLRREVSATEPFEALLAFPGGREAIAEHCPEWRERVEGNKQARAVRAPPASPPGPSFTARARAAIVIAPRVHRLPRERWLALLADEAAVHALLESLEHIDPSLYPDLMRRSAAHRWLTSCRLCRESIRRVPAISDELVRQLIEWWDIERVQGPADLAASYFPGQLLEPAIARSEDAARVFSAWITALVETRALNTVDEFQSPEPFRHRHVRETALSLLFDPKYGQPQEHALQMFVRAWQTDRATWDRLAHYVRHRVDEAIRCSGQWNQFPWPLSDDLIEALWRTDLLPPEPFVDAFAKGVVAYVSHNLGHPEVTQLPRMPARALHLLCRFGARTKLQALYDALADVDQPSPLPEYGLHCAVHLAPTLPPAKARALSAFWAARLGETSEMEAIPRELLSAFIALAPMPWKDALFGLSTAIAERPRFPHQAMTLLPALPASIARDVLEHWLQVATRWELPWIRPDSSIRRCVRIADELRRVAFDSFTR
ncbi:NACHT domain-containing protein [Nannocystis punicea]|uniref:NACHT domain-containing protein n=1 Tax=Nannocystis punicea TaxID=2995304 RepID=A0ABY7HF75_9BACT|nr:hypothetical protein [Nannocystis poenicansa]WAS97927.1 hypothetical protein O0S08_17440 [Nannocystis poenicansa]